MEEAFVLREIVYFEWKRELELKRRPTRKTFARNNERDEAFSDIWLRQTIRSYLAGKHQFDVNNTLWSRMVAINQLLNDCYDGATDHSYMAEITFQPNESCKYNKARKWSTLNGKQITEHSSSVATKFSSDILSPH